jgi:hypothetical protein
METDPHDSPLNGMPGYTDPDLASLESEDEIERLWIEEAERRLDELESGAVEAIPAEEVFRSARAALEKMSSLNTPGIHETDIGQDSCDGTGSRTDGT